MNKTTLAVQRAIHVVLWVLTAIAIQARTLEVDFEDQGLTGGDYWNGSDLSDGVNSRWVFFHNTYETNDHRWSGFAISSVNDTTTPGEANRHAVWTPGTGTVGSAYAIVHPVGGAGQNLVTFPFPVTVNGFFVNNTTYAALAMRDGYGNAKKFGGASGDDPDWFRLTVTAMDRKGVVTGNTNVYLADFRSGEPAERFILNEWTWADLTSLGSRVSALRFALESSDTDPVSGMQTPAYFAMDGLQYVPSFSGPLDDPEAHDAPVPGFVGPAGDGKSEEPDNYVNAIFAGWATQVVEYAPAPGVAPQWTNTAQALGPVTGNNFDIAALGDLDATQIAEGIPPGYITLRMSTPILNRDGPDFVVFENGFIQWGTTRIFAELAYVEVSSDGTNFVRFPSVSLTPGPVGAYGNIDATDVYNLAGKHVNAYGESWGTPFDLADLASHDAVSNGVLNLDNVGYVRIVDIPGSGDFFDSLNPSNAIYDAWVTWGSGGFDLEAIGVINSPDYHRVTTSVIGPGRIDPYGIPGGVVAVAHGSNMTFQISANPGYRIRDVLVNGQSQGPISNYTFVSVETNHTLSASFGPPPPGGFMMQIIGRSD